MLYFTNFKIRIMITNKLLRAWIDENYPMMENDANQLIELDFHDMDKFADWMESKVKESDCKPHVSNCTYTEGQKVKVLMGSVWTNAEVEKQHEDVNYYLCGTNDWSTVFHAQDIKAN